jgi:hypothetical protein
VILSLSWALNRGSEDSPALSGRLFGGRPEFVIDPVHEGYPRGRLLPCACVLAQLTQLPYSDGH